MGDTRETLRVFISYARRDGAEFAEELMRGLEVAGFDAFLDRHDIAAAEDWEARLGALIQSADTIVFVLTPAAAASERCAWEVEQADRLSKRIIPIVALPVPEEATPSRLRRLNYIFFGEGRSYSQSLGDLAKALRVDVVWIREHTRLGELAVRWMARDRSDALVLRGAELDSARQWLIARGADSPAVTAEQLEFIAASEGAEGALVKRERARRRTLIFSLSAATIVFAVLGGVAAILGAMADANARLARQALSRSLIERAWDTNEDQRELAIKYGLAGLAIDGGDTSLIRSALAFAMERGEDAVSVASGVSGPIAVSALSPDGLHAALIDGAGRLVFVDIENAAADSAIAVGPAAQASFNADGSRLVVALADGTGVIINRETGARTSLGEIGAAGSITFSPGGARLLLSGFESQARLWDVNAGRLLTMLSHQSYVTSAEFSADGAMLLTGSGDGAAYVWNAATGEAVTRLETHSYVIDAAFSVDRHLVATSEGRQISATSGTDDAVEQSSAAITIWDVETGRIQTTIEHTQDVRELAFSADGDRLFGLDELGRFVQWDVSSGRVLMMFDGRRFGVTDGVFSRDGSTFVGQSPQFAAVLWEAATNRVIGLLAMQRAQPAQILGSFGTRTVMVTSDAQVVIWDYARALRSVPELSRDACSLLHRRQQVEFSLLEIAADPLIGEAWLRTHAPSSPVCVAR
ncbi:MAG: TIR domain-containing protein [Terricaulis sp.]